MESNSILKIIDRVKINLIFFQLKRPGKVQKLQKHKKYSVFIGSNLKFYFSLLIEISSKYLFSQKGSQFFIKSKLFRTILKNYF